MSEPYWSALGGSGAVDYKGAWAAGTQYQSGDVVRYMGVDYLAVNPSLGVNPGVVASASRELAYAEITATVFVLATAEATPTDIISSGAVVYDGSPVLIEFYSPRVDAVGAAGGTLRLNLWDDVTNLGFLATIINPTAAALVSALYVARRLTPTPGTHTYRFRSHVTATTLSPAFAAGSGGAGAHSPTFVRVSKA